MVAKKRLTKRRKVGVKELADAMLEMMVKEFGDCDIDMDTIVLATATVNFRCRQATLSAQRKK